MCSVFFYSALDRDCIQQILHENDDIDVVRNVLATSLTRYKEQKFHHRFRWSNEKSIECLTVVSVRGYENYSHIDKTSVIALPGHHSIVFIDKKIDWGIYKMSFELISDCKGISCGVFEVEKGKIAPSFTDVDSYSRMGVRPETIHTKMVI